MKTIVLLFAYFISSAYAAECSHQAHSKAVHTAIECHYQGEPQQPVALDSNHHCENEGGRATLVCEARCRGTLAPVNDNPTCTENPGSLVYRSGCIPKAFEYSVRVAHSGLLASDCMAIEQIKKDSPQVACEKMREDANSLCRKKGEMLQTASVMGTCCLRSE